MLAQVAVSGTVDIPGGNNAAEDYIRSALVVSMISLFASLYLDAALVRIDRVSGSVISGKYDDMQSSEARTYEETNKSAQVVAEAQVQMLQEQLETMQGEHRELVARLESHTPPTVEVEAKQTQQQGGHDKKVPDLQ